MLLTEEHFFICTVFTFSLIVQFYNFIFIVLWRCGSFVIMILPLFLFAVPFFCSISSSILINIHLSMFSTSHIHVLNIIGPQHFLCLVVHFFWSENGHFCQKCQSLSRARVTMAMPKLIIATYGGINEVLTSLLKRLEKPCIKNCKKLTLGLISSKYV